TWYADPSIDGSSITYSSISVQGSSTWSIVGYYTTGTNGVGMAFNVGSFTIASGSTLSANATGYAGSPSNSTNGVGPGGGHTQGGGGGYGGAGGASLGGTHGAGGSTYGSASAPVDLGSGGAITSGTGGYGAGAIK